MSKSKLLESAQLVSVIEPVDLTAGANTGDRVSLRAYRRVLSVIMKAAGGTAGQEPVITLQEHNAASGGTSQNLARIDTVYSKQAALWAVEVRDTELSDGFEYVSINIADPGAGNAQIGCVLAILHEPRYVAKGSSMPSAIA